MGTVWYPKLPKKRELWELVRGNINEKLQLQIGIVLIVISVIVTLLNSPGFFQGKAKRSVLFTSQRITPIQGNKYNPAEEGRFIEVAGSVVIKRPIMDLLTGLSVSTVVLSRNSKMYQWDQKSKTINSEYGAKILPYEAYSYIKKWSSKPICSANFADPDKYSNPTMLIKKHKYINDEVYIGDYKISPKILNSLTANKKIILEENIKRNIRTDKYMTILDGLLYIGNDIYSPVVGDYVISYKMSVPNVLTVAGIQKGKEIVPSEGKSEEKSFFIKEGSGFFQNISINRSTAKYDIVASVIVAIASCFLLYLGLLMFAMARRIKTIVIPKLNYEIISNSVDAIVLSIALQAFLIGLTGLVMYGTAIWFSVVPAAIFLIYKKIISHQINKFKD